jgi:hypothetical protein
MRDKIECQFCGEEYSTQGIKLHEVHCSDKPLESVKPSDDNMPDIVVYQQNSSDTNTHKSSWFWSAVKWAVVIGAAVWYMYGWYKTRNANKPVLDEFGNVIVPF